MEKDSKIYVAGHKEMIGAAITLKLQKEGYENLIFTNLGKYKLTDQKSVRNFFEEEQPEYVFLAAKKGGGIRDKNRNRGEFIYENLMISSNIIHYSKEFDVKKLVNISSHGVYPKNIEGAVKENMLLSSPLAYSSETYGIARIAALKMCEGYNAEYHTNFISLIPANIYGYGDNFDIETAHVVPSIIRKFCLGKYLEQGNVELLRIDLGLNPLEGISSSNSIESIVEILKKYGIKKNENGLVSIELWGTGGQTREFIHANDVADAAIYTMKNLNITDFIDQGTKYMHNTHANVGTNQVLSIKELAEQIKEISGFKGDIEWNTKKPDGPNKYLLNIDKMSNLGWKAKLDMRKELRSIVLDYMNRINAKG